MKKGGHMQLQQIYDLVQNYCNSSELAMKLQ